MTALNISKPIRIDKVADKEKHGHIYPDLRPAPNVNEKLGNANDQNLNKMFGKSSESFFNRDTNTIATVALSYSSGFEHYNKNQFNDLISSNDPSVNGLVSQLNTDIETVENDPGLSSAEKQIQIDYLTEKRDKILVSLDDSNEQLTTIDANTNNPIEGEDNFNPDFDSASIKWRYSPEGDAPNDRALDGVHGRQYPNVAFPMSATNSVDGTINLETTATAPIILSRDTNSKYHTDIDVQLGKTRSDISKIMNRYT